MRSPLDIPSPTMARMSDLPPPPPPPPGDMNPPPGMVSYGGAGAVGPGVQPIKGLSKALAVVVALQIPLQFLSAVLTWGMARKAADLLAGTISEDEFEKATRSPLITITSLLFLPTAVLTIMWMYRMASNLRAIGRPELRWTPQWMIFGWFLPPCGIYALPWLHFRELWRASDPTIPQYDPSWRTAKVSPLIQVWWVLYGLVPLIGFATSLSAITQLSTNDDVPGYAEQLDKYAAVNIGLAFTACAAAAVYFVFVRQLSARHMQTVHEA